MLDRDDVDTLFDRSRDLTVVAMLVTPDPVMDLERIGRRLSGGVQRNDLTTAGR
jgi:hypothetical protein